MRLRVTIAVELTREEGLHASRESIAEAIADLIDSALSGETIDSIGPTEESVYSVDSVSLDGFTK